MFQRRLIHISLVLTVLVVNPTHAQVTWNNVYVSPVPDNSRQTESARNSMNTGFDQLRGAMQDREDTDRANWNVRKNNNTQDYLDALYSYKTVKNLLENKEDLERKRIGYGAQIDRDVARSSFDSRLSTLMQQERAQVSRQAESPQFSTQPEVKAQNVTIKNRKVISISAARMEFMVKLVVAQGKQADSPQLREIIKKDLVGREVMMQEAENKGFGMLPEVKAQIETVRQNPKFKGQMENARQSIIINAMLADYVKKNPINDVDIKVEYDRYKSTVGDKEYHARHILVATEAEAKDLITKLKAGGKFEELAKVSKDGSAGNGGDLDWANPGSFVKPFSDAMIALKKGELTQTPVKTDYGYHVIKLEDTRTAKIPTLEELKVRIVNTLQQKKLAIFRDELLNEVTIE